MKVKDLPVTPILSSVKSLPAIGVGDGSWLAGNDTGSRCLAVARLAGGAGIPGLPALVMSHKGHGSFPKDVNLVGTAFQNLRRANLRTLATAVAFTGIDRHVPVPGPVLETIVGDHDQPFISSEFGVFSSEFLYSDPNYRERLK